MAYVSTKFATPEEFEKWLSENEHENKDILDEICKEKMEDWDGKATNLNISEDGKLELLNKNRECICSVDICKSDGSTIIRDEKTGAITVKAIIDRNTGNVVKIWYGKSNDYKKITVKDPNTIYICSDISARINSMCDRIPITANGSYIGAGDYGSSKKNTITFPFVPKQVTVQASDGSGSFTWVNGADKVVCFTNETTTSRAYIFTSLDGNTLSWYDTYSAYRQLNKDGVTYHYFAIGTIV